MNLKVNRRLLAGILFFIIFTNSCTMTRPLDEQAFNELLTVLKTQPEFIKVHAAEYLIWLGHTAEARKEFLHENDLHGGQPKYRIGIWRVLAQTESDAEGKMKWSDKVLRAFGDMNGPDRLHASETLAKLKISPLEKYPEAVQQSLADESRNLQVYTLWAISYSSPDSLNKNRPEFLHMAVSDTSTDVRKISSYILRKIGLDSEQWRSFVTAAFSESPTSELYFSLLTTAYITAPADGEDDDLRSRVGHELLKDYETRPAVDRIAIAHALAEKGTETDLPVLESLLANEHISGIYEADSQEAADVRAAAAYAIIKIKRRLE